MDCIVRFSLLGIMTIMKSGGGGGGLCVLAGLCSVRVCNSSGSRE